MYLLDAYDVPYSIGIFSEENYDELPEGVRICGRLDIMTAALVIMYTPVSRKSVKLPLLMGAIMYEAIMSCPYIDTTNDDDHYSLWQLQMGEYRLLDDNDFTLECCSDIVKGYNTHIAMVSNLFSRTVVDFNSEELKEKLVRISRRRKGKIYESVLDGLGSVVSGTSAGKLADESFRRMVAEQVEDMICYEQKPEIDLQKYVGIWTPEVKFDLRRACEKFVMLYGTECSLNWIDTSKIVDFENLFRYGILKKFNGDISKWDTSSAVYMNSMFEDSQFNGDISGWDVSGVKEFFEMFKSSKFDKDISEWDVSNANILAQMFMNSFFDQDISGWRPVKCWNMNKMFYNSVFSGDISGWPAPKPVSEFNNEVYTK